MLNVLIVADPIESLNIKKDTTIGIISKGWKYKWNIYYATMKDLDIKNGDLHVQAISIIPSKKKQLWYKNNGVEGYRADFFNCIVCRKDPPVNQHFITMLTLLKFAETKNVKVINSAQGMIDMHEKLFALAQFPELSPPSIVTSDMQRGMAFILEHRVVVLKPLNSMGGAGIFKVNSKDSNARVILETMFASESTLLFQKYIPAIRNGDNRIFILGKNIVPYKIVRKPHMRDHRANVAAGGSVRCQKISRTEKNIAMKVQPYLEKNNILLAGLDIIGNYLTEINVTSPTLARELEANSDYPIFDKICKSIGDQCKL